MKSATGTVIIFFILMECRANFTDSISVTKNVLDILQLWKRTNCGKMGKSQGKRWKILRLIYIVLIFFIVIEKVAKIGKNFCTDLINWHRRDLKWRQEVCEVEPLNAIFYEINMTYDCYGLFTFVHK